MTADKKPIQRDALFVELDAAVKPGNDGGNGGKSGPPIPINPSAIDLMVAIKRDAHADHYEMRGFRFKGTVTELLDSYLVPVFADLNDEWTEYLEHVTMDWVDRIDALVRPRKPRRKLAVPCPHCGETFHGDEREVCLTANCWGADETMLPQHQWDVRCGLCGNEWVGHDAMVWFLKAMQGRVAA